MEFAYVIDTGLKWPEGKGGKRLVTDHVQVHHTVGNYGTPEAWERLHRRKIEKDGHKGVGYSYLICKNGDIYLGRGLEYSHGGVSNSATKNEDDIGANDRSVAIAFDGDMRDSSLPTEAQLRSFVRLCNDILAYYDLSTGAVLGHNEVPTYKNNKPTGKNYATECPCMDMDQLRALLSGREEVPDLAVPDDDERTEDLPTYPALRRYAGATYVNLRTMPSTGGQKIGRVCVNDKVIVLGFNGDWAEVILHEETPMLRGWCLGKYFEEV